MNYVFKPVVSRTAKGKSLSFEIFIWMGYICGLCGKLLSGNITYVIILYIINLIMVSLDILVYFRNCRLDRKF